VVCVCLFAAPLAAQRFGEDAQPAAARESAPQTESAATIAAVEARLLHEAQALADQDLAGAIAKLRVAVGPMSSALFLDTLGVYCQRDGRLAEAAKCFAEALERDPAFHRALENLVKVLLQQEDYRRATPQLRELLQIRPKLHWARLALVRILLREQRHAEAIPELATLLDSDLPPAPAGGVSNKGELWKFLGYAWLREDRPQAAESAFRNALAYSPDDTDLRLQMIQSILDQGDLGRARGLVRKELERDPMQVELWRILASADYEDDKLLDALVRLECAHRLGIADSKDLADLGDLLVDQGLASEALARYLGTAGARRPPAPRLLRAAEGLTAAGEVGAAQQLLDGLTKPDLGLTPDQQRRRAALQARIAALRGDHSRALEAYRELLADDPLDGKLLIETGRLLERLDKQEEALVHYERAEHADPEYKVEALVRQGQIAVEREEYRRAVQLLEQALQIEPRAYVERYLEQVRELVE